jgi:PAS domain S-box-containing protein
MFKKPNYQELEKRIDEMEKQAAMARCREEALRKSEERHRLLSEATREALVILRDGILLEANEQFFEMFGYERNELMEKQVMPVIVEPESMEFMKTQISSGETSTYESVGLRKDGTKFPIEIHSKPMEYGGQRIRVGAIRDISERKQSRESHRESETYLESILNRIADPICVKDREHRWILVNDKFCEIAGASREELIGKSDYDFFPRKEADVFWKMDEEVFQTGQENFSEEFLTNSSTGETIFLNTKKSLYLNKGGEKFIVAIGRDLTDRKRFEDSLQFERAQLLSIFNSIPQIIYITDPETYEILYVNETLEKALGNNLVGGTCYEEFQSLKSPCDFCTNDIILRQKPQPYQWEYHNPILNRDYMIIDKIIKWPDGRDVRFEIAMDITERKQAEEALKESEAQKKAILDASVDRIRLVDKDMRIIWANRTTTRELNVSPEEIIGQTCYELLFGWDVPCADCPAQKALETGEIEHAVVHQAESRGVREESYWDDYAVPIKNGSGEIVNLIQITRNITERKKAEEERKKLEGQLRQAQKMEAVGTLAGGIAHDFNNILTPIIVHTEMALLGNTEESPLSFHLEEILKAGKRARDLVKQILTCSRQGEQKNMPLKLGPILEDALKLLRSSLPSTIEIRLNIHKVSGTVLANPTEIHQVVMNLCTNAAHAMREKGGLLEVNLEEMVPQPKSAKQTPDLTNNSYLRLTVRDTGCGMEPEIMEKIFDPYFTTKEMGDGTGLGLSVVHGIVRECGGAISVESEPGKGTTFHVYLPRRGRIVAGKEATVTPIPTGRERILLVDDEPPMVEAIKPMFERLGYEVKAMTNSLDALEVYRSDPDRFDLVVTDMTMPNMTGAELSLELMKIRKDIPIILCTGFSELIDEETAKEMGISAFVMKPIVMRQMAKTVREVLVKSRK